MRRFIKDLKKYYKYALYSTKSELKAEVANSHLSWMWWILDPLLFMFVYSFITVIVFDKSEPYFPVFVFIGLNSWTFFEKTLKNSVKIVSQNREIVSKVYLPKFILVLVKMGIFGFKMVISFILVIIMMIFYRIPVSINVLYIIPLFITLILITFSLSTLMMHFGVFVEDLANVINVVLRFVFYLSGIFFSIENRVHGILGVILLKLNPVALIMDDLRRVMIYQKGPHSMLILVWFVVSVLLSILSIRVIYKYENSYVKVI
ncbi:teichoic acid transport system permease protein [Lachnotalea glycerini]|uniref:Transport permease protein n=1 Tax=Lachnotalea glycerini TaxID=1763509 RepID=A0A255INE9_9FIRM|nr:ABC transporter permease [Lachnotalea glycerini]PXV91472.1 teichoic acid transport system permease protein [Lachnotalea glycerini]RDY30551.1 polysaccharide ABC transporter [Lachnotalea glycerini]